MEDDLKYFCKGKTTSNIFVKGRRPQTFLWREDDLKHFCKWKTTWYIVDGAAVAGGAAGAAGVASQNLSYRRDMFTISPSTLGPLPSLGNLVTMYFFKVIEYQVGSRLEYMQINANIIFFWKRQVFTSLDYLKDKSSQV
jgi:hypothetical protein